MARMAATLCYVAMLLAIAAATSCGGEEKPAMVQAERKPASDEAKPERPKGREMDEVVGALESLVGKDEKKAAPAATKEPEAVAEPKAEEPKAEEPKAEEPKAEEPKATEKPAAAEKPEAAPAEPTKQPVDAPAAQADPATPPPAAPPGPAYFAVNGVGLVKLDDKEFTKLTSTPDKFKDFAVGPDGNTWLLSYSGVHRLARGRTDRIGDYRKPGSLDHLAVAPDGSLWGVGFKGIAHYSGRKWTNIDKAVLGDDVKLLKDVAVDAQGKVWVASGIAIHHREGETWQRVDLGSAGGTRRLFWAALTFGPDGAAYLGHSGGVFKVHNGETEALPLGGRIIGLKDVAAGADGTVYALAYKELLVLPPKTGVVRFSGAKGDFKAQNVEAMAADARGRVWAATDLGMVVIDRDQKVVEWPQGSVPLLSGSVKRVRVIAGGPELPTTGAVRTGAVTAKLLRGGQPVVGAEVEICKRPASMFRESPCHEAPWRASTKTDAKGAFTFREVPLGTYRFAVKNGAKWATGWQECCAGMKQGQTFDAGALTLK